MSDIIKLYEFKTDIDPKKFAEILEERFLLEDYRKYGTDEAYDISVHILITELEKGTLLTLFELNIFGDKKRKLPESSFLEASILGLFAKYKNTSNYRDVTRWQPMTEAECIPKTEGLRKKQLKVNEKQDKKALLRTIHGRPGALRLFFHRVNLFENRIITINWANHEIIKELADTIRAQKREERTHLTEEMGSFQNDRNYDQFKLGLDKVHAEIHILANAMNQMTEKIALLSQDHQNNPSEKPIDVDLVYTKPKKQNPISNKEVKTSELVTSKPLKNFDNSDWKDLENSYLRFKEEIKQSDKIFFEEFLSGLKVFKINPSVKFKISYETIRRNPHWKKIKQNSQEKT